MLKCICQRFFNRYFGLSPYYVNDLTAEVSRKYHGIITDRTSSIFSILAVSLSRPAIRIAVRNENGVQSIVAMPLHMTINENG